MSINTLFQIKNTFINDINAIYQKEEALEIFKLVFEHLEKKRYSSLLDQNVLSIDHFKQFENITSRLLKHEPIQYILNEAWFYNHMFYVDQSVLIPRSETELLVQYISEHILANQSVLDLCTGSGCIPISIALFEKNNEITAIEIDQNALAVAQKNELHLCKNQNINWIKADVFSLNSNSFNHKFNWITSNPPYIGIDEKKNMAKNVINYEPHLALFSDSDPLLFYQYIIPLAKALLFDNGCMILEINPIYKLEIEQILKDSLLNSYFFINDFAEKPRFVVAKHETEINSNSNS